MDATAAAAMMLANPDHFFKYYPVQMIGGTGAFIANNSNPRTYYLAKKDPTQGGPAPDNKIGHFGATRPGFLGHTRQISSFVMEMTAQPNCSGALATHGVPMVNYNSDRDEKVNLNGAINALDHYVVGPGANYMTTGGLSGCCFAWIPAPGGMGLWCVHIRPEGTEGGALQDMVDNNGHFAGAPGTALSTFGRRSYGGTNAIIVGVNTPGGWRLYGQASTDMFRTITAAWRLHPGGAIRL